MNKNIIIAGGDAPEVLRTHVVALYDPQTGNILHTHTVTIFNGGREVAAEEAIETAKTHAKQNGLNVEKLKIKFSNDAFHGFYPHRIDVDKDEFIALDFPKRKMKKQ
jgi:hypothetical protein